LYEFCINRPRLHRCSCTLPTADMQQPSATHDDQRTSSRAAMTRECTATMSVSPWTPEHTDSQHNDSPLSRRTCINFITSGVFRRGGGTGRMQKMTHCNDPFLTKNFLKNFWKGVQYPGRTLPGGRQHPLQCQESRALGARPLHKILNMPLFITYCKAIHY